jgi:hypothetical protein
VEFKAKNSKVALKYAEHKEHDEIILVRAPKSKTRRPVLSFVLLGDCAWYKGRLAHLILASG